MIPFVKTKAGMMPANMAAELERRKAAAEKAIGPIDMDFLARQIKEHLKHISPLTLNRLYPCRTCSVVSNDNYRAACAEMKAVECFITARFRGCPVWSPRPTVVGAT